MVGSDMERGARFEGAQEHASSNQRFADASAQVSRTWSSRVGVLVSSLLLVATIVGVAFQQGSSGNKASSAELLQMLAANRGSLRYDVQTLQRLQEEDGGDGGDEDLARQRAELTKQETQHMLQRQAALKNAIARSDALRGTGGLDEAKLKSAEVKWLKWKASQEEYEQAAFKDISNSEVNRTDMSPEGLAKFDEYETRAASLDGVPGYQALLNMSYEGDANRTRDWQGYLDRARNRTSLFPLLDKYQAEQWTHGEGGGEEGEGGGEKEHYDGSFKAQGSMLHAPPKSPDASEPQHAGQHVRASASFLFAKGGMLPMHKGDAATILSVNAKDGVDKVMAEDGKTGLFPSSDLQPEDSATAARPAAARTEADSPQSAMREEPGMTDEGERASGAVAKGIESHQQRYLEALRKEQVASMTKRAVAARAAVAAAAARKQAAARAEEGGAKQEADAVVKDGEAVHAEAAAADGGGGGGGATGAASTASAAAAPAAAPDGETQAVTAQQQQPAQARGEGGEAKEEAEAQAQAQEQREERAGARAEHGAESVAAGIDSAEQTYAAARAREVAKSVAHVAEASGEAAAKGAEWTSGEGKATVGKAIGFVRDTFEAAEAEERRKSVEKRAAREEQKADREQTLVKKAAERAAREEAEQDVNAAKHRQVEAEQAQSVQSVAKALEEEESGYDALKAREEEQARQERVAKGKAELKHDATVRNAKKEGGEDGGAEEQEENRELASVAKEERAEGEFAEKQRGEEEAAVQAADALYAAHALPLQGFNRDYEHYEKSLEGAERAYDRAHPAKPAAIEPRLSAATAKDTAP